MFNQIPIEQRRQHIFEVYQRMAKLYQVDVSQLHLAIGCDEHQLKSHQFHGEMPIEFITQCREKHNVSIDWIINGKEPPAKVTPEQLDSGFNKVVCGLLMGLNKGENVAQYWQLLRNTFAHRAARLRKEKRWF